MRALGLITAAGERGSPGRVAGAALGFYTSRS
jgi:hypothetical protein